MNSPRCKLNEMAIIIKPVQIENVGKIITCIEYLGYLQKGDLLDYGGTGWAVAETDHYWIIQAPSKSIVLKGTDGNAVMTQICVSADHRLVPLKPDTLVEETSTTKELTVN